jgi:hypothetical protein
MAPFVGTRGGFLCSPHKIVPLGGNWRIAILAIVESRKFLLSIHSAHPWAGFDVRLCAGLLAGHGADKVHVSQGFKGDVQQWSADV